MAVRSLPITSVNTPCLCVQLAREQLTRSPQQRNLLGKSTLTLGIAPRSRHHVLIVCKATKQEKESRSPVPSPEEKARLRDMEDELRDPKYFIEYFLPRPLRLAFFLGSALSCFIATVLSSARLAQDFGVPDALPTDAINVVVNIIGLVTFAWLYTWDESSAERRKERRQQVRQAQIEFGDREVFFSESGDKMSRLKEVNDDWILRRLERWGRKDNMPFVGPAKGKILQGIVAQKQPQVVVEVGTLCGYSALIMAQCLPPRGHLISIEKDWLWVLVAKRFMWQASQGSEGSQAGKHVEVWWGDARNLLGKLPGRIDMLFLDGLPKEYLQYLQAAEPFLSPGSIVVADNAGVFAAGGLKDYLQYVRSSPKYSSSFVESTLEWREDVMDGLEISMYLGDKT